MARTEKKGGGCFRVLLILINVAIIVIGLVITVSAALFKYDKNSIGKIFNIETLAIVIKFAEIKEIPEIFLAIGIITIIFSLLGLLGACCLNKCLLILYAIVCICLFLTHGIALLVIVSRKSSIEQSFRNAMTDNEKNLNNNSSKNFNSSCDFMQFLSLSFKCCGNNSPLNINSTTIRSECCKIKIENDTIGCTQKAIDTLKSHAMSLLVWPSCAVLSVELLVIFIAFCTCCGIRSYKEYHAGNGTIISKLFE